jgi:hypothetical protein
VVLPLQNPHKMFTPAFFTDRRHVFSYWLLDIAHSRTDCSLCYLTQCWLWNITWMYPRLGVPPTLKLSLPQKQLQIANMFARHLHIISVLDTLFTKQ